MSPELFEACGPLPAGVTVLEASAGTGKTFTIAALAARYVAEGTPLERLLLVTFTRMATGELRERVRERLVETETGAGRRVHREHSRPDDEVLRLLVEWRSARSCRCARRRLQTALDRFRRGHDRDHRRILPSHARPGSASQATSSATSSSSRMSTICWRRWSTTSTFASFWPTATPSSTERRRGTSDAPPSPTRSPRSSHVPTPPGSQWDLRQRLADAVRLKSTAARDA